MHGRTAFLFTAGYHRLVHSHPVEPLAAVLRYQRRMYVDYPVPVILYDLRRKHLHIACQHDHLRAGSFQLRQHVSLRLCNSRRDARTCSPFQCKRALFARYDLDDLRFRKLLRRDLVYQRLQVRAPARDEDRHLRFITHFP